MSTARTSGSKRTCTQISAAGLRLASRVDEDLAVRSDAAGFLFRRTARVPAPHQRPRRSASSVGIFQLPPYARRACRTLMARLRHPHAWRSSHGLTVYRPLDAMGQRRPTVVLKQSLKAGRR